MGFFVNFYANVITSILKRYLLGGVMFSWFNSKKDKKDNKNQNLTVVIKPLDQIMNENSEKFTIDKNGFVHLDLNSEKVQKDIRREIDKLKNFAV